MRHTPEAIRYFLDEQSRSGLSIADYCSDNDLKVPTFYSWKKKYNEVSIAESEGFCKITPTRESTERSLCLPSGLRLSIAGLSIGEIAELVLEIDRAHA